ncbi:hypothetical protein TNCV_751571 [Trichonephila clavipes]|uniref:Uncharacterized protein n=1 Tax=Trichonephila clavipes TaxID=2585209 RepID=A0A8X6WAG9_TRICX|nr:hypothetical protein TNCV_751571 [Trichonephila clavipes]
MSKIASYGIKYSSPYFIVGIKVKMDASTGRRQVSTFPRKGNNGLIKRMLTLNAENHLFLDLNRHFGYQCYDSNDDVKAEMLEWLAV